MSVYFVLKNIQKFEYIKFRNKNNYIIYYLTIIETYLIKSLDYYNILLANLSSI